MVTAPRVRTKLNKHNRDHRSALGGRWWIRFAPRMLTPHRRNSSTIFNITYRDCDKGTGSVIICVRRDDIRVNPRLRQIGWAGVVLDSLTLHPVDEGATGGFLRPVSKSFNHVSMEFTAWVVTFWLYMHKENFCAADYPALMLLF